MSRPLATLAIVPTYLRSEEDLEVLLRCLVSLSVTAPELELLVVDDASPATDLVNQLASVLPELGGQLLFKSENSGFSASTSASAARSTGARTPCWSTPTSSSPPPAGGRRCATAPTPKAAPRPSSAPASPTRTG